jgi:hypothetical protein
MIMGSGLSNRGKCDKESVEKMSAKGGEKES